VTFVHADGVEEVCTVDDEESIMEIATTQGIDGIVAECGGNMMCATCHVYLALVEQGPFPPVSVYEDAMLAETASPRTAESRLSCQLIVHGDTDVRVRLPESQL